MTWAVLLVSIYYQRLLNIHLSRVLAFPVSDSSLCLPFTASCRPYCFSHCIGCKTYCIREVVMDEGDRRTIGEKFFLRRWGVYVYVLEGKERIWCNAFKLMLRHERRMSTSGMAVKHKPTLGVITLGRKVSHGHALQPWWLHQIQCTVIQLFSNAFECESNNSYKHMKTPINSVSVVCNPWVEDGFA